MTRPDTQAISPFFIVSDVDETIAFYRDKLGFALRYREPDSDPFFAIIGRDGAQIFIKSENDVAPLANPERHPSMRWDAFVYAADPDALAVDFAGRGAPFSAQLKDTQDGLRGFEIRDPNGYVLFFGRPIGARADESSQEPSFVGQPQLFVSDVEASSAYYTKKLGFTVAFTYGEPPFYGQVSRGGASLNLRLLAEPAIDPAVRDREQLLAATIALADAESLFLEFQTAGVEFRQTLKTEPWGARTFIVRDPDGNLVLFSGKA